MQLPSITTAIAAAAALVASAPAKPDGSAATTITLNRRFAAVDEHPMTTALSTLPYAAQSTPNPSTLYMSPSAAPSATSSAATSISPFGRSAPVANLTRGPDHPIWASECIFQCAPKVCQFTVRMRGGPECAGKLEQRLRDECTNGLERFHCDWRWNEVYFWAPKHSKRPKVKLVDGKFHKEPIGMCVGKVAGEIWKPVVGCHGI